MSFESGARVLSQGVDLVWAATLRGGRWDQSHSEPKWDPLRYVPGPSRIESGLAAVHATEEFRPNG